MKRTKAENAEMKGKTYLNLDDLHCVQPRLPRKAQNRNLQETERTCEVCGVVFLGFKWQKYCSVECKLKVKKEKQHVKDEKQRPKFRNDWRLDMNDWTWHRI